MNAVSHFFYGTLMDTDMLEAVIGKAATHLELTNAWIEDHIAETACGYTFPTLTRRNGYQTQGILARGLTEGDISRIAYFEDADYEAVPHIVGSVYGKVTALIYVPARDLRSTGEAWSFEHWRLNHKQLLLAVTHKIMQDHYGQTPIEQIDAIWHQIKNEFETELRKAHMSPPDLQPALHAGTGR